PIGDPPYYFGVPDILAEKRWPTRQELDAAAPNNPVFIRSIWGFWRHSLPLVSIANTEALRRAGITRDTVSPVASLTIEKDGAGEPTGVFVEREMQPLAELIWFRQFLGFTRADRARALRASMQAYHAYGTTSVFEEHGVANEVIRAYKDVYRDGALTMRSALAFSPNWKAAGNAPLGPFIEGGRAGLGSRYSATIGSSGRVSTSTSASDRPTICAPARRPIPVGQVSTTTPACRASSSKNCCCTSPRTTSARSAMPIFRPA